MGMRIPSFPIYLRAKDDREVREFDSLKKMQKWVEAIDVENNEYEGWDREGFPIALDLQVSGSISVKLLGDVPARQAVLAAFADFATTEGASFEGREANELHEAYDNVKKAVEDARKRQPWWRRVLRRF
jgi:hypothetical protein